ncbi:MAG: hypothetical protein IJT24_01945 [Lachnospiraceae bacterium]|nr:hypothetical protein [Lachnospiraceae bacterium]
MAQNNKNYSRKQKRKRKRRSRNKVIAARLIFVTILLVLFSLIVIGLMRLVSAISDNIGSDDDVSTVSVLRNGEIKQTIIEEFDPGTYDEASLKKEVEEKAEASNGGVEAEGFSLDDGTVTLKLKYATDDDMAAFNDEVFYADTIDNLLSQGVTFDSEAIKAGGTHAVIVSEAMDIRCPKKILYTGGDVTIDEDDAKLAHCSVHDGDLGFVIY